MLYTPKITCHVHPKYKAIRKPRAGCVLCRAMWQDKLVWLEEQKRIDEYDALPGTPPDCYSSFDNDGTPAQPRVRESIDMWRKEGMTHFRVTVESDCTWIEGWTVRPYKEAPFNPPYTAEPS